MPDDAPFEAPGDPDAIPREVAVFEARNLFHQDGNEVSIRIDGEQWFIDDT
jgi:hypothetical protein